MNRNIGLSAGMLALIAVIFHISPLGSEQQGGNGDDRAAMQKPEGAEEKEPTNPDLLEGPWLATRAIFGKEQTSIPADKTRKPAPCNEPQAISSFGISQDADVEKILATVPDPWHTRLALFTDGALDAIEASASANGWIFAAQWLPWQDPINPEIKNPSSRRMQRLRARCQEDEPGVLVFRQSAPGAQRILLVFVVGETPTGGIDRVQFRRARFYMQGLPRRKGPMFVLAPTFSGSFYSLRDLRKEDSQVAYVVRDGNASSVPDSVALREADVTFSSTNPSSIDYQVYFCRTILALRIRSEKAAILSEDETRFGELPGKVEKKVEKKTEKKAEKKAESKIEQQVEQDCQSPVLTLKFPRDISQLRNAYRDSPPASTDKRLPAEVQFSLKDSQLGEDSIPSYSGTQGPLSQDARLEEDVDIIRRNQIQAVEIIASNALDALFLARVLQRKSPDTRVVLPYANLLFVEAARSEGLRNVLSLSSYPLFGERNWWRPKQYPLLTFPDSPAEGVFNATSLLLYDIAGTRMGPNLPALVDDYWWDDKQQHPPMWLLALDREGFVPVRAWDHAREDKDDTWWEKVDPSSQTAPASSLAVESSPVWKVSVSLIGLAGVATLVWSLMLWSGDLRKPKGLWMRMLPRLRPWLGDPRWDGRFYPRTITEDRWRIFYLFNFVWLLAAMLTVLCLPQFRFNPTKAALWGLVEAVVLILFALTILAVFLRENGLKPMSGWAMIGTIIVYVAGQGVWDKSASDNADWAGLFFSLRAAELRIGTSPALPILAGLFAMALYCYVQMHRIYLVACQEPSIALGLDTVLKVRLEKSAARIREHFASAFGLIDQSEWAYLAAGCLIALVAGFWLDPLGKLVGIDGYPFNFLLTAMQSLVVVALVAACIQMMGAWLDLRTLLAGLESLPLAAFFIARSRVRSNRPIWVQNLNIQSLSALVRAPMVFHDIALQSEGFGKMEEEYFDLVRILIPDAECTRGDRLEVSQAANNMSGEIAVRLFNNIVRPHWKSSALVGPLEKSQHEDANTGNDPTGKVGISGDPAELADLAQAFVALHFTPFLIYSVRQIRNMVWFLSLGFVALALSMNADSPQAPQLISRFLIVLFALIAVVLWRCLAGIERDPIISRIEGTKPGEPNFEFYFKLFGYGALPILGLLASEFPGVGNFVFSWLQPTLTALK